MDADALAERILLDLKNTFKKDPLIDEFDILPVSKSLKNTSPVIHVDHKVALEDWCVKHVYVYAYSNFFSWRKKQCKVDYNNLTMWSSAILLINPEPETVWNARKELVCQNMILPEQELKFSEIVLSRKPKSAPVYAHRKWLLLRMKRQTPTQNSLQQIVDEELCLCSRSANLYPNNYYAWSHRSWVLKEMVSIPYKTVSEELECTEKWASTHVSDHCGFHYRQFLLSCLHESKQDDTSVTLSDAMTRFGAAIKKELMFLEDLQSFCPGHEALWYHRRYILTELDRLEKDGLHCQVCYPYDNFRQCGLLNEKSDIEKRPSCSNSIVSLSNKNHGIANNIVKFDMKCANASGETNGNNIEIGSSIEKINSMDITDGNLTEGSVRYKRHNLDCPGAEQEHMIKNGTKSQSSNREIHSLALKNISSIEEPANCNGHTPQCINTEQKPSQVNQSVFKTSSRHNSEPCSYASEINCSGYDEDASTSISNPIRCKRYKLQPGQAMAEIDTSAFTNTTNENLSQNGVAHYKRHKLDSSSRNQGYLQDEAQMDDLAQEKLVTRALEEAFLKKMVAWSKEEDWERILIQKHIKWLLRVLQWSIEL